jgi:hypothetical protein
MSIIYKGKTIAGFGGGGSGGGVANVDEITIITQLNGSISALGTIDQNSSELSALKSWTGTLSEYEAMESHDIDTLYYITDDDEFYSTDYIKRSEFESLQNEVGSISSVLDSIINGDSFTIEELMQELNEGA